MLCRIGSTKDLGYPLDSKWYLRDFYIHITIIVLFMVISCL